MPGMDGVQAASKALVRAAGLKTPIVALTADAFEDDRKACLAAGMDDFLAKPLEAGALRVALGRWARPQAIAHQAFTPEGRQDSPPDLESTMTRAWDATIDARPRQPEPTSSPAPSGTTSARRWLTRPGPGPACWSCCSWASPRDCPSCSAARTLGYWLRDAGTWKLKALIGFLSWVGLAYSLEVPVGCAGHRPGRPAPGLGRCGSAGGGAGLLGPAQVAGRARPWGPWPSSGRRHGLAGDRRRSGPGGGLRLGHPGHRHRRLAHRGGPEPPRSWACSPPPIQLGYRVALLVTVSRIP